MYEEIGLKSPRNVDWKTPYTVNFALSDTESVSIEVVEVPISGPNLSKGERDPSLREWIAAERLGSTELDRSDGGGDGDRVVANHDAASDVVRQTPSKRKRF